MATGPHKKQYRLGELLVMKGVTTQDQIEIALTEQKQSKEHLGKILVRLGFATDAIISDVIGGVIGQESIDLTRAVADNDAVKMIPKDLARRLKVLPIRYDATKNQLTVAMVDIFDVVALDQINAHLGGIAEINPVLAGETVIDKLIDQFYGFELSVDGILHEIETGEIDYQSLDASTGEYSQPVVRLVDALLSDAVKRGASDIHFEPEEGFLRFRYRIDGVLRDAMVLPRHASSGIVARIKVLSNLKLDEHRLPQDGRFKVEAEEYKYSVRVSILPVFDGEKIVMRLLSETAKAFTLEELGLRGDALEYIEHALKKPVGMLLVTGPTGSGKTTTLYSAMEILNTPDVNISTVEDPVEYRMPRINQTQVNPKIGLTFASGLRSLLRQDPDIIMVGEIRDQETASLAINAALTGHLVLSTLHTNSAAGAIPRFIEMGGEPFLIASTLNVIVAQRLVRKLAEEKEPYKLSEKNLKNLGTYCNLDRLTKLLREEKVIKQQDTLFDATFYKPKASKDAEDGYKGRIGIYEVLPVSESIKVLIVQKATSDQIQKQAQQEGMVTMVEDGLMKAAQGITSIEEILRVVSE
ncbi:Flp pilus assembly complex ATPase component TadA [Patescibacteria group bacterium]|nr:Flp pilus assembly complex ATPase component TadA [Patescibacteria group bacterium]